MIFEKNIFKHLKTIESKEGVIHLWVQVLTNVSRNSAPAFGGAVLVAQ